MKYTTYTLVNQSSSGSLYPILTHLSVSELWTICIEWSQKPSTLHNTGNSFQQKQDLLYAKYNQMQRSLSLFEEKSNIHRPSVCMSKLLVLRGILCGKCWKFRGWVAEPNKLFACLSRIGHSFSTHFHKKCKGYKKSTYPNILKTYQECNTNIGILYGSSYSCQTAPLESF